MSSSLLLPLSLPVAVVVANVGAVSLSTLLLLLLLCACSRGILCCASLGDAGCVTRRMQHKPSNTQESKQRSTQQRTTATSSANLTEPNQTPTRYTFVKDAVILHVATPQAASSYLTYTCRTYQGMRPHAPGKQAGGHLVSTHTERHNPPKVWTQR